MADFCPGERHRCRKGHDRECRPAGARADARRRRSRRHTAFRSSPTSTSRPWACRQTISPCADGRLRSRALRRRHHGRARLRSAAARSCPGVLARLCESVEGHGARSGGAIDTLLRHSGALSKDIELERLRMAIRDNIVTPTMPANSYGGVEAERFAAPFEGIGSPTLQRRKTKPRSVSDPSFLRRRRTDSRFLPRTNGAGSSAAAPTAVLSAPPRRGRDTPQADRTCQPSRRACRRAPRRRSCALPHRRRAATSEG